MFHLLYVGKNLQEIDSTWFYYERRRARTVFGQKKNFDINVGNFAVESRTLSATAHSSFLL